MDIKIAISPQITLTDEDIPGIKDAKMLAVVPFQRGAIVMEVFDTGAAKYVIGIPTDEEREALIRGGYVEMSRETKDYEPCEKYEIWMK